MENHIEIEETEQDKGFTLVELLIVIVILGILATVTVFAVTGITTRGKDSACKADLKTIQTAEEAYNANTGDYGTQDQLKTGGLIHEVPAELQASRRATPRSQAPLTPTAITSRQRRLRRYWNRSLIQTQINSRGAGPSGPAPFAFWRGSNHSLQTRDRWRPTVLSCGSSEWTPSSQG